MKKFNVLFATIAVATLILSACGGTSTPDAMMHDTATPDAMMHDTATPAAMMHGTATPDAMMQDTATPVAMMYDTATPDAMMHDTATPVAMMEMPAWYGLSLSDAATGKSFSINDLKGKVVLVETMAQMCSNCKKQLDEVKTMYTKLGMQSDFVSIGLDVEPKENGAGLKDYVAQSGFAWMFAISPANITHEIASLYGDQFMDPTSMSILIIDRHGVAHALPAGFKNSDDLYKLVSQYLKGGM